MSFDLRVLSYNIHKGFSATNQEFVLAEIKRSIEEVGADLVLLQEVIGQHEGHASKIVEWPTVSQFEFLADRLWPHYAYGKNSVYQVGHHGNAILSKFPIVSWENEDISQGRLDPRGLLHAEIEIPGETRRLHVLCSHFGLFERYRETQLERLCQRIETLVPRDVPMIVGGDFNDWREIASRELGNRLGLSEAIHVSTGRHARTFPSWLPVLKLDRLYYRGLNCRSARLVKGEIWRGLSDHLPIFAEFGNPR